MAASHEAHLKNRKAKVHAPAYPAIYLCSDDDGIYTRKILENRKIAYSCHVTFDGKSFPALNFEETISRGSDVDHTYVDESEEDIDSSSDEEFVKVKNRFKANPNLQSKLQLDQFVIYDLSNAII